MGRAYRLSSMPIVYAYDSSKRQSTRTAQLARLERERLKQSCYWYRGHVSIAPNVRLQNNPADDFGFRSRVYRLTNHRRTLLFC